MMMIATRATAKVGGLALILLMLFACGDGDGDEASFEGVYRVASHTRSLGDCEKEGAPFHGDSFFKLSRDAGVLSYQPCESAESCAGADRSREFDQKVDSEWIGMRASASASREACSAQLAERVVNRLNGDNIQIEVRQFSGEFERDEDQECSESLVVSNREALECHQRDIIKATPVAQP